MYQLYLNFAGVVPILAAGLAVAAILAVVLAAVGIRRGKPPATSIGRGLIVALSCFSLFAIAVISLAPHNSSVRRFQLIPFHGLIAETLNPGLRVDNVFANVLLYIPFGLLMPWAWKKLDSLGRVAAAAAALSVLMELLQLVPGGHETSVNDVMLNTLGAVIGYGLLASGRWAGKRIRTTS